MRYNHKVVAITPAGRRPFLEILERYIIRDCDIIDRWMIWVNTPHARDLEFIGILKSRHPDFVELVYHPDNPIPRRMPQNEFFPTAISPETVYVKFDDDIVWVEDGAVEKLVDYRLANREPLFVMSNTICNGYCAYIHAKIGAQDFHIDGKYHRIPPAMTNSVWSDAKFAEYVHGTFIRDLADNDLGKYKFESWKLDHYERVAINCICWLGSDFAEFGGKIDHVDEELWLCCMRAREVKRPVEICGRCLVAHYSSYKQTKDHGTRDLDSRILSSYRLISRGIINSHILESKIM